MMKRMTAWKQAAVLGMAVCMTAGLVGCGSKDYWKYERNVTIL